MRQGLGTLARGGAGAGTARALTPVPTRAALHAEPYIMFSTDKKSLLCIRCFRDMQGWVAEPEGSPPGPRAARAGVIRCLP